MKIITTIFLSIIALIFLIQKCNALKCYQCMEDCTVDQAMQKQCGITIGPSQAAICTKQLKKGTNNMDSAVRKCTIVQKDRKPTCPEGFECHECDSDLCNGAITYKNISLFSIISGIFAIILVKINQ